MGSRGRQRQRKQLRICWKLLRAAVSSDIWKQIPHLKTQRIGQSAETVLNRKAWKALRDYQ